MSGKAGKGRVYSDHDLSRNSESTQAPFCAAFSLCPSVGLPAATRREMSTDARAPSRRRTIEFDHPSAASADDVADRIAAAATRPSPRDPPRVAPPTATSVDDETPRRSGAPETEPKPRPARTQRPRNRASGSRPGALQDGLAPATAIAGPATQPERRRGNARRGSCRPASLRRRGRAVRVGGQAEIKLRGGHCDLYVGQIETLAGVRRSSVKNATRKSASACSQSNGSRHRTGTARTAFALRQTAIWLAHHREPK